MGVQDALKSLRLEELERKREMKDGREKKVGKGRRKRGKGERELFLFSQGHNPRGLRLQLMTSLNLKYFLKT